MDTLSLFEIHKICRICLKNDILVSIFSPTFLLRPIEMIEKLNMFKLQPDDNLPTLLCQSCLYRLLDAYNLKQLAESSERRLRDYLGSTQSSSCSSSMGIGCELNLNNFNPDSSTIGQDVVQGKDSIDTTAAIYANICDMFERNVQSSNLEVEPDDVLNDVEIDVSSLTRSEADDTLSEVLVSSHVTSCYNTQDYIDCQTEHHNVNPILEETEEEKSTPYKRISGILKIPEKCLQCGKVFNYSGYLDTHKRIHTGEKPFKCDICTRHFAQSSSLQLHQRTHTGEKRFQCEICSSFFSTSSNLKAHRLIHLESRDIHCGHCERRFKSIRELRRHMPIHKSIKDIVCDICDKAFTKRNYLTAHIAAVHRAIRKHKCTECSKVFGNKSNLICHMRTHTGEKPFQCKYCPWKFNQSSALLRHMKKHSSKSELEDPSVKPTICNTIENCINSILGEEDSENNYSAQTLPSLNNITNEIGNAMGEVPINVSSDSTLSSSGSTLNVYDFNKGNILNFSNNQQNQTHSLY